MDEKFEFSLPSELVERLGDVMELLDFGSVGEFVETAVRRLLDEYLVLTWTLVKRK